MKCLLVILILISHGDTIAQKINFSITIFDYESQAPIKDVAVINEMNNSGAFTDSLGFVNLKVMKGDSLLISIQHLLYTPVKLSTKVTEKQKIYLFIVPFGSNPIR